MGRSGDKRPGEASKDTCEDAKQEMGRFLLMVVAVHTSRRDQSEGK